jgi:hypothetical protein
MMDEEERERRRRYVEDMLEMLRDMDAADALRAAMPHAMPEPGTQSFGEMPLLSSARSERWRADALEVERKQKQADAAMKADEARIIRQRQQAAERVARIEMTEEWTDVLGQVVAEVRHQLREEIQTAVAELRAELAVQREAERGQILDLPALPSRRRRDAA